MPRWEARRRPGTGSLGQLGQVAGTLAPGSLVGLAGTGRTSPTSGGSTRPAPAGTLPVPEGRG